MCSIFALLYPARDTLSMRPLALRQSRRQRHRGPDWSGIVIWDDVIMAHERLAIVDVEHGAQPLLSDDEQQLLAVNGEIYNHQSLRQSVAADYAWRTASDCEVILPLYRQHGAELVQQLSGMYAFVLYDRSQSQNQNQGQWLAARDPIGIIPLYYGRDSDGQLMFASEMKALADVCSSVKVFPPGHYWHQDHVTQGLPPQPWYRPAWRDYACVQADPAPAEQLRTALEQAVTRHLMSDVPYGVLLSGGLDSSIIAALAMRHAERRIEDNEQSAAWWPRLHSFAIGLEGSPDLAAAKRAAEHIGTIHHSFTYTIQEGLDALEEVIYHLETYDVTTIRAATPMFLMARKIRAMGIKMVLSGEGADEIFGGYLYFHKAPDAEQFHIETVRKLDRLHLYDCLRANKAMAAWGVEARVPFLDREFIDVAMRLDPALKMARPGPHGSARIEKQLLRAAFADLLPDEIAWRQKEQFSDGVGYGWIDTLKSHASQQVSEQQMLTARERFPYHPSESREAYYYRDIFQRLFPLRAAAETVPSGPSVACSTPEALAWDESLQQTNDPSGRAVAGVHHNASSAQPPSHAA